jgi:hypothetical protein
MRKARGSNTDWRLLAAHRASRIAITASSVQQEQEAGMM